MISFMENHALSVSLRTDVDVSEENFNKTWMYMPDGDGDRQIAFLVEPATEQYDDPLFLQYEFHNSDHPDGVIFPNIRANEFDTLEVDQEIFNSQWDTKILAHGWTGSSKADSMTAIKNAYKQRDNVNIILIDWSTYADNIYYLTPARYTKYVGRNVAQFINHLVEKTGADPKRIHLIGFSLGAHVMGYAGLYTKYRVGRITGLDPASPGFEDCIGPDHHLDETDADFVDIIHSCAGFLGFRNPVGSVDFYPNGGLPPQPGCSEISQIFSGCSHGRSYEFFAESVNSKKGFYASLCDSLDEALERNCTGSNILMGDPVPHNARGIYYVKTADNPEYALGKPKNRPKNNL